MRVSVVMICKNEEAVLGRCLESVKEADEIIICDTGSTDRTIEIAKQFTDKVFTDYVWEDNFAKARNHALSKATGDWVLSIDADEYLTCPFSAVREAAAKGFMAVNVKMTAESGPPSHFWFPRLFLRSPNVWWEGAIHNHISVMGEDVGAVTLTYGYSPAHTLDPLRSMRILEKEVADRPDCIRERFYLGREYFYRGQYDQALVMLGRYVQQSRFLAEKAEAFLTMSRVYWALLMPDDARDALVQCLIINPRFKEAVLFMAELAGDGSNNPRWQKNADQWKRMAETADNDGVLFLRT
jgi:glycosyltransferase involved in cell wall biosynthesis